MLAEELAGVLAVEGAPRFASRQVMGWLYRKLAGSFDEMTDLGKLLRSRLAKGWAVEAGTVQAEFRSPDGSARNLIRLRDGAMVESVVIPERGRVTLCVSSQAGCARGCSFCATARLGPGRNLEAGEILEQAVIARRSAPVSNVVFMGMGEPLDNYEAVRRAVLLLASRQGFNIGARHIVVSTAGVVPGIRRLAADGLPCQLTVSLNAPDDGLRSRLMPVNRAWPLAELEDACREYAERTGRRVTLAYVLLRGVNDAPRHASKLASIARGLGAKVNLIPWNRAANFERPTDDAVAGFQRILVDAGVLTLLRKERGGTIGAACGQLALKGAAGAGRNA
jgi:23S rRNA (adenine2503-C2)-methyltransferase